MVNSHLLLGEPVLLKEVLCTLIIAAGSTLAAVFGPLVDTELSIACIDIGLKRELFQGCAISVFVLQIVVYAISRRGVRRELRVSRHWWVAQSGAGVVAGARNRGALAPPAPRAWDC